MHLDPPLYETVDERAPKTTLDQFAAMLLRKQSDRFPLRGSRHYQSAQAPAPNWAVQPAYAAGITLLLLALLRPSINLLSAKDSSTQVLRMISEARIPAVVLS